MRSTGANTNRRRPHINEYNRYTYARSALATNTTNKKKRETFVSLFSTQSRGRTGTGVNLLVFETSASTDSAIWATDFSEMRCKCMNYFLTCKIFAMFFTKNSLLAPFEASFGPIYIRQVPLYSTSEALLERHLGLPAELLHKLRRVDSIT